MIRQAEIADHHLVEKVGHDRFPKPDLVSVVGEFQADAGGEQAKGSCRRPGLR